MDLQVVTNAAKSNDGYKPVKMQSSNYLTNNSALPDHGQPAKYDKFGFFN